MPGKQSGKNSAVRQFFDQNKSLVFLLPLLVILVVVLIIVYSGNTAQPAMSEASPASSTETPAAITDQTQVDVLPRTERAEDKSGEDAAVQDPFTTPMELKGIFAYPDDRTKVIIAYGGVSYIVRENETIGETGWKVAEVFDKSTMVELDGRSTLLELRSDSSGQYASAASTDQENESSETITIRLANADMRDVISALVLDLGYNVVYYNNAVVVDRFEATDITPETALSLLLKSEGMDYIQDGDTMIVGPVETLNSVFFDSMVLTRFTLKYVDADTIANQIDNLGLSVQKVTLDSNPHSIWIQGLPRELGKVRELIAMLDRSENVSALTGKSKLASINLTYITAQQMNDFLKKIGLQPGLVLESNPRTLYVYVNDSELAQIQELKAKLDIPDNQSGSDFVMTMKKLTYVKASEIAPIIPQFGLDVDVITFDRTAMAIWLKGDEESVNRVCSLIDMLDIEQNIDNHRFFVKRLKYITALEAAYRLSLLNIPEIRTYTFSYPQFSKCILVVCPEDYKIFVMDHLNQLDVAADKIKVPVDYSKDASGTYRLEQRRDLLVILTGIPKESFTISKNVSRDNNPYYVLILEETPEKIKMVEDMIAKLDDPLNNEYEPDYETSNE